MSRIDESTKRQRKERVQLIVARADGLRESEIAEQAGLEQRTTNNYLRELEYEGHLFKDGLLWYALNVRGTKLRSFELSPEETYTLYLAARLLVKQQDKRNEPAETALLKLAKVLSSDLGVGNEIAQAAAELAQRPVKAGYESVFRTMVQGYLYRRRIDLTYRPYGGRPFSTVFSPYLLEPSAIGYTTYAIGHSSAPDALRSYRLDRIETARVTREFYQVPADFPGLAVLRNAWSIMIG
ncbi:MAG: WYL domain-containing protein, partial [Anaerolineae bacterium]|nr:WYL domain-containing protein [Anaerolineae bacterium]